MANYQLKQRPRSYPQATPAPNQNSRTLVAIIAVILVIAAVLLILGSTYTSAEDDGMKPYANGLSIGGIPIGGLNRVEIAELVRPIEEEMVNNVRFTINAAGETLSFGGNDVRFSTNVSNLLDELYSIGRTGDGKTDRAAKKELKKNPMDYPVELVLDRSSVSELVQMISAKYFSEPINAGVNFDVNAATKFTYTESVPGKQPNTEKLATDLINLLESNNKNGAIILEISEIQPDVSAEDAQKLTIPLSRYSTKPDGTIERKTNLRLSMQAINGTVIEPGGIFSYNEVLGERTEEKGYMMAATIVGGGSELTLGGGICQGATTCYGAMLVAGMEVVERFPHSWPMTYCKPGEDATVAWPDLDLKMRNVSDYPLYFVTTYTAENMTVEIFGMTTGYDQIKVVSEVVEQTEPDMSKVTYKVDTSIKRGESFVEKKPRGMMRILAQRVYYIDGVEVKRENLPSTYHQAQDGVILWNP